MALDGRSPAQKIGIMSERVNWMDLLKSSLAKESDKYSSQKTVIKFNYNGKIELLLLIPSNLCSNWRKILDSVDHLNILNTIVYAQHEPIHTNPFRDYIRTGEESLV